MGHQFENHNGFYKGNDRLFTKKFIVSHLKYYPYKGAQSATSGGFVFYTNVGPQGTINTAEGVINLDKWTFAMEKAVTAGSYTILNGRKSQSTAHHPPQCMP